MTYLCVLDYTERELDARRRMARGERQVFCLECGLWRWPEECAHTDRLTAAQFKARTDRVRREVVRLYPSQEARYRDELKRLRRVGRASSPPPAGSTGTWP